MSPIDAMSRMQTVSSTTVLPHERPVNTVFCRKMLMRAMDASSGNSEVRASTIVQEPNANTVGQPCRSDTGQCTDRTRECSGVHALPSAGRYSNSLIGSRVNSAVHHRGNSRSRIGATADLTV